MSRSNTHPEIGSLVNAKDEMWRCIENRDYVNALRKMYRILLDIRREDTSDDFKEKVRQELATLDGYQYTSHRMKRINRMSRTYWMWASDTIQILWDKDYLMNQKYGALTLNDLQEEEGWEEG